MLTLREYLQSINRWRGTVLSRCSSHWKRRQQSDDYIWKYEGKIDAEAVLPFGNDLQSVNNGVLRCQCEKKIQELMVIKCLDVIGPHVVIIDTSNWHMRRTK
ncbi:hypothetical protein M514_10397 [Trichuris suis]|uniref:Uncharacterized protein n=1 Tax=Trichuris suis TaxID=68888 RepID=A0A085NII0_9BILA|nr:hypothetical protein M513_10397 [Trichuris suis]KFD69276.1 hypothetical protein M514_10397 [Trichuris suis]